MKKLITIALLALASVASVGCKDSNAMSDREHDALLDKRMAETKAKYLAPTPRVMSDAEILADAVEAMKAAQDELADDIRAAKAEMEDQIAELKAAQDEHAEARALATAQYRAAKLEMLASK